jgi:hypothetical protein
MLDVRQNDMHSAEPLESEPNAFEVEMAIEKLKRYKLPGIDEVPLELVQSGSKALCSETHKVAESMWNKKELCQQWKKYITVPIYKKGDK